jgi:hypothetical protein
MRSGKIHRMDRRLELVARNEQPEINGAGTRSLVHDLSGLSRESSGNELIECRLLSEDNGNAYQTGFVG